MASKLSKVTQAVQGLLSTVLSLTMASTRHRLTVTGQELIYHLTDSVEL